MENIDQDEADRLIKVAKYANENESYLFPFEGRKLTIPLTSIDQRENFSLDISRSKISIKKCTFNNRSHGNIILVRLDLGGPPHRNPDGQEIPCPHIHVYREGFGDKWAFPPPQSEFKNLSDIKLAFNDFMTYINVQRSPILEGGLLI